jgi:hypothetical protein
VSYTIAGLFVGLLLGLALIIDGFGPMLVVALFGVIGFVVGKVADGQLDLTDYLGGRRSGSRPPVGQPR